MAVVVAEIVVGEGERGNGVEAAGGRWDKPIQANARGERLDYGETADLDEVGSGSLVLSCRAHAIICMRGEEGVPRRSPGSRSADPESRIVWYPLATKISVPDEAPSRGSMLTR